MHSEDFSGPGPAMGQSSAKRCNHKEIASKSKFAAADALGILFWAAVKAPLHTLVILMGSFSLITAIGPFIAGFAGFAAAPNAHVTQKVANGASLYLVRPVVNGVFMAATEAAVREQNTIVNPSNTGTLTAQQVSALRGMQKNGTQVRYIINKKP
jgi:Na+/pantothenate symporter